MDEINETIIIEGPDGPLSVEYCCNLRCHKPARVTDGTVLKVAFTSPLADPSYHAIIQRNHPHPRDPFRYYGVQVLILGIPFDVLARWASLADAVTLLVAAAEAHAVEAGHLSREVLHGS